MTITDRAKLYLLAVEDWKAPFEIPALLGDSPPETVRSVQRMLTRLRSRGLVECNAANITYRATDKGLESIGRKPR